MNTEALEADPFDKCATHEALGSALEHYAGDLGLPYYSYLLLRPPHRVVAASKPVLITNYPDEWRTRYLERYYQFYDPVVVLAGRARLPFCWNSGTFLRPFRKNQKRVFHEAREFRIVSGYSIPVCGPEGDVGLVSMVGARDADLSDVVRARAPFLQLAAVQMHDRFMRLLEGGADSPSDEPPPVLTARERECLRWTADGKTTDEIADRVCLTASTVNYHLGKAVRKLGASNRHHAAILAIRAGQI